MLHADDLDAILTLQLAVAFAGERAAPATAAAARLGWWNTDLYDEFGGLDLLADIAPRTARWAALQTAREAARRAEAKVLSTRLAGVDAAVSLYWIDPETDRALDERLRELKSSGSEPTEALPALAEVLSESPEDFSAPAFAEWLEGTHVAPPFDADAPAGRQLAGEPPASPRLRAEALAAALVPLPAQGAPHPLPHWRVAS